MEYSGNIECYPSVRRENDFEEMLAEFNREGMKPVAARGYKKRKVSPSIEVSGNALGFRLKIGFDLIDVQGIDIDFE